MVTVNVAAAVTRGNFLRTSATSGQATASSTGGVGDFAIALTGSAGAGTVKALIKFSENF